MTWKRRVEIALYVAVLLLIVIAGILYGRRSRETAIFWAAIFLLVIVVGILYGWRSRFDKGHKHDRVR